MCCILLQFRLSVRNKSSKTTRVIWNKKCPRWDEDFKFLVCPLSLISLLPRPPVNCAPMILASPAPKILSSPAYKCHPRAVPRDVGTADHKVVMAPCLTFLQQHNGAARLLHPKIPNSPVISLFISPSVIQLSGENWGAVELPDRKAVSIDIC